MSRLKLWCCRWCGEYQVYGDSFTSPTNAGDVMVELRAEDVKELREALGMMERNHLGFFDSRERLQLQLVAAAARAWLASQEQTPDYEAATEYVEGALDEPLFEMGVAMEPAAFARRVVDAALAGVALQTDYIAAAQVLADNDGVEILEWHADLARRVVDAALVGFHPGDKGDER